MLRKKTDMLVFFLKSCRLESCWPQTVSLWSFLFFQLQGFSWYSVRSHHIPKMEFIRLVLCLIVLWKLNGFIQDRQILTNTYRQKMLNLSYTCHYITCVKLVICECAPWFLLYPDILYPHAYSIFTVALFLYGLIASTSLLFYWKVANQDSCQCWISSASFAFTAEVHCGLLVSLLQRGGMLSLGELGGGNSFQTEPNNSVSSLQIILHV